MRPEVRDLYKRFVFASRDYPGSGRGVLEKVKEGFMRHANAQDELAVKRAVAQGRYFFREIVALNRLHKYRAMKKRYGE
ncbi:hypothetical protein EON65_56065 [archaeon]|nr:MAG: hypothetical protein EON65_56065 [archaeon]